MQGQHFKGLWMNLSMITLTSLRYVACFSVTHFFGNIGHIKSSILQVSFQIKEIKTQKENLKRQKGNRELERSGHHAKTERSPKRNRRVREEDLFIVNSFPL
jgi:hypothetical protein